MTDPQVAILMLCMFIFLVLLGFPIAFTLMSIRIIQVNYLKLFKGVDVRDPEKAEVDKMFVDSASYILRAATGGSTGGSKKAAKRSASSTKPLWDVK